MGDKLKQAYDETGLTYTQEYLQKENSELKTRLDRTRKALDVAVDALKEIKSDCYDTTDVLLCLNKALDQITALEQKE